MRLDVYLVEKGYFDSRTKAKQSIERGEIFIDEKANLKSSFEIDESIDYNIKRIYKNAFVSLGGFKLKKALDDFNLSVENLICVDIGSSTGGFTDCLLQGGAKKVYAVDLNAELLHPSLKENHKVISIIKNVKNLSITDFKDEIDLVVADLSFISITQALPIISSLLMNGKILITLIKPQFETGERIRFKNGVIRDRKVQLEACYKAYDCALENNLSPLNFTTTPKYDDKNLEFLMLCCKNASKVLDKSKINF